MYAFSNDYLSYLYHPQQEFTLGLETIRPMVILSLVGQRIIHFTKVCLCTGSSKLSGANAIVVVWAHYQQNVCCLLIDRVGNDFLNWRFYHDDA